VAASYTPLRWMAVRQAAFAGRGALARARRRRLEARGDRSHSRPALEGMDVRLGDLLGPDGYFVEAGGHDGYTMSNTYYLERWLGWRGLLVEAIPFLAAEARRNRPNARVVEAALVDPQHAGEPLRLRYGGVLSFVAGTKGDEAAERALLASEFARGEADVREYAVPGRTLSAILDEVRAPEVTLLSLDLEGFEAPALRGLDLDRHGPRWLLVEAHEAADRDSIDAVLGDRYVHVERFSGMDELYRRADVPAHGP
jgi:FkbM family methyltransferase